MDPALWELLEGNAQDEVEAIIRLQDVETLPTQVKIVSRFGNIVTCRLRRGLIPTIRADEAVASFKAPRYVAQDPEIETETVSDGAEERARRDQRRPTGLRATGRGVVVGVCDWGCDFAHPNFRHPDGSTRLLALWDQRPNRAGQPPAPYGYGTVFTAEQINQALATRNPYRTLGYHPAQADPFGNGAHGTHVMDIAAGNGAVGQTGIAPRANLVFVHLATRGTGGLANLGDSVSLLEAVDFIAKLARKRPWVINLSVGRHGGPHEGSTLVEQGLDATVMTQPGRAIVQSTGNYFDNRTHATGRVTPDRQYTLRMQISSADRTPNELEVWYSSRDRFVVQLQAPDGTRFPPTRLGEQTDLMVGGRRVGRLYHRANDPNNNDHHINAFFVMHRVACGGSY